MAVVRWESGEKLRALETAARSLETAGLYRYVRIYTGYGAAGAELLQEYRSRLESARAPHLQEKKKYRYGSVLNMPPEDWLDYIIRKASRQKKHYPDLSEDRLNIYRAERLTATELIVLRYLEEGYSNAVIGGKMNIKLSTVQSPGYNNFIKLGGTPRLPAVPKAKENGLLLAWKGKKKKEVLSYSGMGRLPFFDVTISILRRTEKTVSSNRGPEKMIISVRKGISGRKDWKNITVLV